MVDVPVHLFGCLPVIASINYGMTDGPNGRDYYSDVEELWWRKRDGSKGERVPQHIVDRAEKLDPYHCSLVEEANDWLMFRDNPPDRRTVQLL